MINKYTLIREIEVGQPNLEFVFSRLGLGHLGSLSSFFDTVAESAKARNLDPDYVVDELNKYLVTEAQLIR